MSSSNLTFQQRSLVQQGYENLNREQLRQLEWGLRFTPLACSVLTLYGLAQELPGVLLVVSFLGIWAFLAPGAHPMDLLYNHGVRHFFGAVKLPPNPFQRRLACFAAGIMNATAAALFWLGQPVAAKVVGGVLLVLQAIVITTHFCALSWIYEGAAKLLGRGEAPIELTDAKKLLAQGARLIDVREPYEFERGHLEGAVNIPLNNLEQNLERIGNGPCLVYCASGMRSRLGIETLRRAGIEDAHNLGSLNRGEELFV